MTDADETSTSIRNWKNFTRNSFEFKIREGNLFFIYNHVAELVNIFENEFKKQLIHEKNYA